MGDFLVGVWYRTSTENRKLEAPTREAPPLVSHSTGHHQIAYYTTQDDNAKRQNHIIECGPVRNVGQRDKYQEEEVCQAKTMLTMSRNSKSLELSQLTQWGSNWLQRCEPRFALWDCEHCCLFLRYHSSIYYNYSRDELTELMDLIKWEYSKGGVKQYDTAIQHSRLHPAFGF